MGINLCRPIHFAQSCKLCFTDCSHKFYDFSASISLMRRLLEHSSDARQSNVPQISSITSSGEVQRKKFHLLFPGDRKCASSITSAVDPHSRCLVNPKVFYSNEAIFFNCGWLHRTILGYLSGPNIWIRTTWRPEYDTTFLVQYYKWFF